MVSDDVTGSASGYFVPFLLAKMQNVALVLHSMHSSRSMLLLGNAKCQHLSKYDGDGRGTGVAVRQVGANSKCNRNPPFFFSPMKPCWGCMVMLPSVGLLLLRVQDRPILALLARLVHASDPVFNQIDSAVVQSFPDDPQAHLSPYQANG